MGKKDRKTKQKTSTEPSNTDDLFARKKTSQKGKSKAADSQQSKNKEVTSYKWIYYTSVIVALIALLPTLYMQFIFDSSDTNIREEYGSIPSRSAYSVEKYDQTVESESDYGKGIEEPKDKNGKCEAEVPFDHTMTSETNQLPVDKLQAEPGDPIAQNGDGDDRTSVTKKSYNKEELSAIKSDDYGKTLFEKDISESGLQSQTQERSLLHTDSEYRAVDENVTSELPLDSNKVEDKFIVADDPEMDDAEDSFKLSLDSNELEKTLIVADDPEVDKVEDSLVEASDSKHEVEHHPENEDIMLTKSDDSEEMKIPDQMEATDEIPHSSTKADDEVAPDDHSRHGRGKKQLEIADPPDEDKLSSFESMETYSEENVDSLVMKKEKAEKKTDGHADSAPVPHRPVSDEDLSQDTYKEEEVTDDTPLPRLSDDIRMDKSTNEILSLQDIESPSVNFDEEIPTGDVLPPDYREDAEEEPKIPELDEASADLKVADKENELLKVASKDEDSLATYEVLEAEDETRDDYTTADKDSERAPAKDKDDSLEASPYHEVKSNQHDKDEELEEREVESSQQDEERVLEEQEVESKKQEKEKLLEEWKVIDSEEHDEEKTSVELETESNKQWEEKSLGEQEAELHQQDEEKTPVEQEEGSTQQVEKETPEKDISLDIGTTEKDGDHTMPIATEDVVVSLGSDRELGDVEEPKPSDKPADKYSLATESHRTKSSSLSELIDYQESTAPIIVRIDKASDEEGYFEVSPGVKKKIIREGTGRRVNQGDLLTMHCVGYLDGKTSKKFWSTKDPGQRPFTFAVGKRQVIKGWDEGAASMRLNERSRIKIDPEKAYGKHGFEAWGIPANCGIIFEIDLIKVKRTNEY